MTQDITFRNPTDDERVKLGVEQPTFRAPTGDELSELSGETIGGLFVNTTPVQLPGPRSGQFGAPPGAFGPGASLGQATPRTSFVSDQISLTDRVKAALGVDVKSELDSPEIREALGFAPNKSFKLDFIGRELEKKTGIPAEKLVRFSQIDGGIEFFNPTSGRWTPLDANTLSFNDLKDLYGPGTTLGSALGGSMIGAFVSKSGAVGATLGGAAGAFWGEMVRLQKGKRLGVHDLDDDQILWESFKIGSVDLAAGLAGEAAITLRQLVRNLTKPTGLQPEEAKEILKALSETENVGLINEINSILAQANRSERLRLPAAQVSGAERGQGLVQAEARTNLESEVTRKQELKEAETALDVAFRVTFDLPTAGVVGRDAATSKAARDALAAERRRLEDIASTNLAEAERMASTAIRRFEGLDRARGGEQMLAMLNVTSDALRNNKRSLWTAYQRSIGQPIRELDIDTGLVPATREFTSNIKIPVTQPVIDAHNAAVALRKASPLTGKAQGGMTLRKFKQGDTIDLAVLDESIKQVRSTIREANAPLSVRSLRRTERTLVNLRNDYLRQNHPTTLATLENAEAAEKAYQSFVSRSVLSDIIKVDAKGQFVADNVETFVRVWSDKSGKAMRELVQVAERLPGGRAALRKLGFQLYTANARTPGAKFITKAQHDAFVDRNQDVLKALYNDPTFYNFGRFAANVERTSRIAQRVRGRLGNTTLGRLAGVHPEKMGKAALSENVSQAHIREAVKVLEQAGPEALKSFQDAVGRELWGLMTSSGRLSIASMNNQLRNNFVKLQAVFGKEHTKNIERLIKGLNLARPETVGAIGPQKSSLFGLFARATFNPPLTRRGRVQTLAEQLRFNASNRALHEALRDPKLMQEIIKRGNKEISERRLTEILSVLGATAVMLDDDPLDFLIPDL